jgi:hypothetical protein
MIQKKNVPDTDHISDETTEEVKQIFKDIGNDIYTYVAQAR